MAFKVVALAVLLVIVAINATPQFDQLPGGMTPPSVGEMPVGGNQTNPGDMANNMNMTVPEAPAGGVPENPAGGGVPENPAGGVGGAENATMPSNIGSGLPNRIGNSIRNRNSNRNKGH